MCGCAPMLSIYLPVYAGLYSCHHLLFHTLELVEHTDVYPLNSGILVVHFYPLKALECHYLLVFSHT